MKISKRQLRRIIKEELEEGMMDNIKGFFTKNKPERSTDKDFSAVKSWLSSNGFGESEVFDGADRAWQNEANDEDFVILRQFITATDFDWDKMNNSAKEEINVAFIKSVGNNTKPVYAYVRY